jgi:predicted membrane-bound spermidine synthase
VNTQSVAREFNLARSTPLLIAVFLSGASALVYETVWTRSFSIILGSTVEAASATFAAFLVGLAIGAWLIGRRSPPLRYTLHAYIAVEVGIAVLGPLCGVLLHHYADALALVIGSGPGPRGVWAFGAVLLIVLLPTVAIGGTFPLMLTAARRLGEPVTAIGRLYGVNTLGSAVGAILCGFFLIRWYGVQNALWVGAFGNLTAAFLFVLLRRYPLRDESDSVEARKPVPDGNAPSERLLLWVAAGSGALVLGLEVVWTRLASYFLGNRIYAFTTLLACVLVLLAMGSGLASRLLERSNRRVHDLLGWMLVTAMTCTVFSTIGAWWWIRNQTQYEQMLPGSGELLLFYRAAETFVLLAPSLLALGCLFPLSLMCSSQVRQSTGRTAGRFYAANTAGSVVGSLGVGFWGASTLGAFGATAALVWVGALLALAIFSVTYFAERRTSPLAGMGSVLAVLVLAPLMLPAKLTVVADDERLAFRREDAHGVLQVLQSPGGITKVTNNRTHLVFSLGLVSTSFVQEMQGHLAMFHRPQIRSAAVIGSGYGVTAGALTSYPGIEHIDAVEILPGLIEAADLFRPYNYSYHRDPRVTIVVDDGRHFLARSGRRYDMISVNVTDPHLPGASGLFHSEFYEIAKRRLTPGGVLVQHVFGDGREIILRTLLESFAYVRLFPAYRNGYNAIASDTPLDRDLASADALLEHASVRRSLSNIGVLPPVTPSAIARSAISREEVARQLHRDTPLATDNRPRLEFAWGADAAALLFSNE